MDEELIDLTIEETVEINAEEVVESEVRAEDLEQKIETEEAVDTVEVETIKEISIEMEEAVGWTGGDSTRHYSLYGRDEPNQHPITSITGLREELNDIEALNVVYSNERNQANYYLWEDENILQEDRVGYFVSAYSDINEIKICTSDSDIFGVTVDGAGFIGGQSDVARDIKYGLVVTTGIVHVRCELPVEVGDYVISNDYGYAQSNKNGFKVVGRHQIDGVEYAEIILTTPIGRICQLSYDVENVNTRMTDAETNIVAAINIANAAYNKAGEVGDISEEAIKNALEAIEKADGAITTTDKMSELVSSANEAAVQAKAIAESATVSAEAIRNEAVKTSNEALAEVNDLIEDLEPITTWSDPESGNTGAEYFTTYIKDGLATKVEVQTVETKTDDNKSAIEHNAESFRTLVASVDKYSVGEYSQSYGLTHEQAESILKVGVIYVPTKHSDSQSHSETFEDTKEENWFTPGAYYTWTINDRGVYDWVETKDSVAFFSEMPIPSSALQYWYIDSDEAPEGYEPRALYIYEDGKWVKVNIFYNNPGNRMVSSISQEVDNISLEITNARGSYAGLNARLEADNEAQVAMVASVVNEDGTVNTASIVNAVTDGKSSTAITADHIVLNGYNITNGNGTFSIDDDGNMFATGGKIGGWAITSSLLRNKFYDSTNNITRDIFTQAESGSLSSAFAVREASGGDYTTTDPIKWNYNFYVANDGSMYSTKGTIGGWTIDLDNGLYSNAGYIRTGDKNLENTMTIESGHIDFYYNGNKTGRLGQTSSGDITIEGSNGLSIMENSSNTLDRLDLTFSSDSTAAAGLCYYDNYYKQSYNLISSGGTSLYIGDGNTRYVDIRTSNNGEIQFECGNTISGYFDSYGLSFKNGLGILLNDKFAFRHYQNAVYVGIDSEPLKLVGSSITANGTGITSDERKKNTIIGLDNKYTQLFDTLSAKTYKFNEYRTSTTNCGFIAQELLSALSSVGLSTDDFGGFVDVYGDGREYAIDYTQFIPIMWEEIKSLRNRISELENKE